MRTVLYTTLALLLLGFAGIALSIYSGVFNVAASDPHWRSTYWVMESARVRSIKAHAVGIVAPTGLDDPARVVAATEHFSQHCAVCHGAPGAKRGDLASGMYPLPPDLTDVSRRYTPEQLFWILKNGIKMSGMPSMANDGDDMLWSTVAFLEKLPTMSADDYNDLWMEAQAQGGTDHMMNMPGMDSGNMNMTGMTMAPSAHGQQPTGAVAGPPAPTGNSQPKTP